LNLRQDCRLVGRASFLPHTTDSQRFCRCSLRDSYHPAPRGVFVRSYPHRRVPLPRPRNPRTSPVSRSPMGESRPRQTGKADNRSVGFTGYRGVMARNWKMTAASCICTTDSHKVSDSEEENLAAFRREVRELEEYCFSSVALASLQCHVVPA
jgi:hypothetical protein